MDDNKQYGYLTTITWSGIVNVTKVILEEHTQFIHSGSLYTSTDQDRSFGLVYSEQDLSRYKEVHFNGCVIYKDWRFWRGWF